MHKTYFKQERARGRGENLKNCRMNQEKQRRKQKSSDILYDNMEDKAKGQSSRNVKRKEEGEREQGLK